MRIDIRDLYERLFGVHVYGHERTIHGTSTVDVQLDKEGKILRVWFRCLQLPFRVSYEGSGKTLYEDLEPDPISAIETRRNK